MRAALLFVLAGCGRIAFDPFGASGDGGPRDGAPRDDGAIADVAADTPGGATIVEVGSVQGVSATMTVAGVMLQPGDTLLVVTSRRALDTTQVAWGSQQLTEDVPVSNFGNGPIFLSIWSAYVAAGGTGDIIAQTGGSGSGMMFAFRAPLLVPSSFDVQATATGTGAVATSNSTSTTAASAELVLGFCAADVGSGFTTGTWSAGFAPLDSASASQLDTAIAYRMVLSTGNYAATYSGFTSRNWGCGVGTYKAQ